MLRQKQKNKQQKGFVTLLLVLVTGAIGIAISTSVILSGLSSSRNSFTISQSNQARALADTCAEIALEHLRDGTATIGGSGFTSNLDWGDCLYYIVPPSPPSSESRTIYTMNIAGKGAGNAIRKVRVIIDKIKPKINVTSWQEIQ